jgi:hypothetical protein
MMRDLSYDVLAHGDVFDAEINLTNRLLMGESNTHLHPSQQL